MTRQRKAYGGLGLAFPASVLFRVKSSNRSQRKTKQNESPLCGVGGGHPGLYFFERGFSPFRRNLGKRGVWGKEWKTSLTEGGSPPKEGSFGG